MQLGQWRTLRPGVQLLDITVRSGIKAFAPHGHDLAAYKRGGMSDEEYTERYLDKMAQSRRANREQWDHLSVLCYKAIACYCKAGDFCHRHIFKELAKTHLESMGWGVALMGEWTAATRDDPTIIIPEPRKKTEGAVGTA